MHTTRTLLSLCFALAAMAASNAQNSDLSRQASSSSSAQVGSWIEAHPPSIARAKTPERIRRKSKLGIQMEFDERKEVEKLVRKKYMRDLKSAIDFLQLQIDTRNTILHSARHHDDRWEENMGQKLVLTEYTVLLEELQKLARQGPSMPAEEFRTQVDEAVALAQPYIN